MRIFKTMLVSAILFGCNGAAVKVTHDLPTTSQGQTVNSRLNTEMMILKDRVLSLQGVIEMLNTFVATDFSTCSSTLPPFEQKICQIAQSANAEQMLKYTGQLSTWVKTLSSTIYGADCLDVVEVGCPAPTSALGRINEVESDIAILQTSASGSEAAILAIQTDITNLQADLATLTGRVDDLEDRLNDFNGSGSSIETVVAGIQTSVAGLVTDIAGINGRLTTAEGEIDALQTTVTGIDGRVTAIESSLDPSLTIRIYEVCEGVPQYTRPESILISGDWSQLISYTKVNSSDEGLSSISETDSSLYTITTLSPKDCRFKVYTFGLGNGLNVCWDKTNRSASEATINTICNNGTTPYLANCQCLRDYTP